MESLIGEKSFAFAVVVVRAARVIRDEQREYDLAGQFLRSGTSIGANVSEARYAQSKKDFISKHKIALKEANECRYWLRLLSECEVLDKELSKNLIKEVEELIKILTAIIRTSETKTVFN